MKSPIQTRDAPEAIGTYSQAARSRRLDGVPVGPDRASTSATMQMAEGIDAQTHRVFRNLAAVAAAAGLSLDHAVRMTVYLTDLAHFARVNEIMAQYVREPYPARAPLAWPGCHAARWSRSTQFCTPIRASLEKRLHRLGLRSRADLALHLPLRYEDETFLPRSNRRRRPRPCAWKRMY